MRETAERMWTQIREWFSSMPRGRKIQLVVLSLVVIGLAIFVVSLLTRTNWVRLTVSDPATAPQVYAALNEMGVPTQVENGVIFVPEERLGDAQMRLREQNLLGAADFSFDIMEGASGFGVTDNHAKRLYDYQTGELIRTQLLQTPRIQNALVIVNSGETSPFRIQTNARQASASVMLTLGSGGRLTQSEVQSVGDVIMGAVPGIEAENISINDTELHSYRYGDASQSLEMEIGQRDALQNKLMMNMKESVEDLLAPILGPRNLKVQPYVKLNFDRVVTEQVEFEPPIPGETEGILRSSEEIYENSRRWRDAEGIPGTDSNNMGTVEYPFGTLGEDDEYRRAVLSRNYEINETRRLIEHEQGVVEEVMIAVLINSEAEDVEQDFSEEITDLVAKAIGVAPNNISVQQVPFVPDRELEEMVSRMEEEAAARRNRELLETILMYVVIVLLGVMVMMLVRTVIRAVKPPPEPEPLLMAAGPDGIDLMVGDEESTEMEYEDVDLQTKSPGLEQIERFIDKDSATVAQLLRNWLGEE